MAENFDLIFGQNASQQYAWNDTDYQNGWETIGNIPPTAAQFDALQRRADMKSQELNSRLITVEASIAGGAGQKREADTTYAVGDVVSYDGLPMDWVLVCIVDGTSGSADITLPSPRVEGARILDGTVTWALRKIATYGGIGYRQSSTACPTGSIAFSTALPAGWYLEATTGGTTSASDIVITSPSVGATVTDGAVVWTIREMASTADIPAPVDISGKANVSLNNLSAAGEAKIQSLSPRYLTNSYYNASTGDWWRQYSDGWIEQGGFLAVASNASTTTLSLLKPMLDTSYNISLTRMYNATISPSTMSGSVTILNNSVKTTTSFKFIGYQHGVYWHVVGKGA